MASGPSKPEIDSYGSIFPPVDFDPEKLREEIEKMGLDRKLVPVPRQAPVEPLTFPQLAVILIAGCIIFAPIVGAWVGLGVKAFFLASGL